MTTKDKAAKLVEALINEAYTVEFPIADDDATGMSAEQTIEKLKKAPGIKVLGVQSYNHTGGWPHVNAEFDSREVLSSFS
jgi:hypothetical protein